MSDVVIQGDHLWKEYHQPPHWTGTCPQLVCRAGQAELPFHRGTNRAGKSTLRAHLVCTTGAPTSVGFT